MNLDPATEIDAAHGLLLSKAVQGDALALEQLLVLHAHQVRQYIRHHLPRALAANYEPDDILQDVFVEACRRIAEVVSERPGSFVLWLLTIARHQMIGLLRQVNSQKRGGRWSRIEETDAGFAKVISVLESLAVFYRTPSMSAMSHEVASAVQQAIDRLGDVHREAIRLRHIEGLSAKDAATRMKRTEGAFHLLCNRGLKKLREDLKSRSLFV